MIKHSGGVVSSFRSDTEEIPDILPDSSTEIKVTHVDLTSDDVYSYVSRSMSRGGKARNIEEENGSSSSVLSSEFDSRVSSSVIDSDISDAETQEDNIHELSSQDEDSETNGPEDPDTDDVDTEDPDTDDVDTEDPDTDDVDTEGPDTEDVDTEDEAQSKIHKTNEIINIDSDSDSDVVFVDIVEKPVRSKLPVTTLCAENPTKDNRNVWRVVTDRISKPNTKNKSTVRGEKRNDIIDLLPSSTVTDVSVPGENRWYYSLLDLLPDADLDYLKQQSKNITSEDSMQDFVLEAVSKQNYPRRLVTVNNNLDAKAYRNVSVIQRGHSTSTAVSLPKVLVGSSLKNGGNSTIIRPPKNVGPSSTITANLLPEENRKYNFLLDLLPDADHEYLMQESKKARSDEDLQMFVLKAVSEQNYPRKSNNNGGNRKETQAEISLPSTSAISQSISSIQNVRTCINSAPSTSTQASIDAPKVEKPQVSDPQTRATVPNVALPDLVDNNLRQGNRKVTSTTTYPTYLQYPNFLMGNVFQPPYVHLLDRVPLPYENGAVPLVTMQNRRPYYVGDATQTLVNTILAHSASRGSAHTPNLATAPTANAARNQIPPVAHGAPLNLAQPREQRGNQNISYYEKYRRLVLLLPDARNDYITALCEQLHTVDEIDAHVRSVVYHRNYPKRTSILERQLLADYRRRRRRAKGARDVLMYGHTGAGPSHNVGGPMFTKLVQTLPSADLNYLQRESLNITTEEDFQDFLLRVLANDFPRRNRICSPLNLKVMNAKAAAEQRYILLTEMLPDANLSFLRQKAASLDTLDAVGAFALSAVSEQNYPKRKELQGQKETKDNRKRKISSAEAVPDDPKLLTLKEMLPDADPEFLQKEAKNLKSDQEVEMFIVKAVESKDYPKMDAYLKRKEYKDMWAKYLGDFKVEEYLQVFPDPINYFYFEKIRSKVMPSKFLQFRYRLTDTRYLTSVFEEMTYNLTKTCDKLDVEFPLKPNEFGEWDGSKNTMFDVTLLQEIAFIQNKKKIAQHILSTKQAKAEAYQKAKEAGQLIECGCCADECLSLDIATCGEGHLFCKTCIKRGSEVVIGDGKTTFPCYNSDCKTEFSLEVLKDVLRPDTFSRLLIRKQYEEVKAAGIPGLESCPFCEFCSIPDVEDKLFTCLNPPCMKVTCRFCKRIEHLPFSCEEVVKREETELKMKQYVEERMTEALVRTCYKCGTKFIKDNGCNLMQCQCGARMCYVCRQPIEGYEHFRENKCEQNVELRILHVKDVVAEGKKARLDIEAANPGMHLSEDPAATF